MRKDIDIVRGTLEHQDDVFALMQAQLQDHNIEVNASALKSVIVRILTDASRGMFLLAVRAEQVVGVAFLSFMCSLEHPEICAWLDELYVLPAYRRQGIGGRLIDEVLEHAARQGCTAVDLEVERSHADVEALYQRKGFTQLDRNRWVVDFHNTAHE
jgi:GNAT superfamily N-acetyltransferase